MFEKYTPDLLDRARALLRERRSNGRPLHSYSEIAALVGMPKSAITILGAMEGERRRTGAPLGIRRPGIGGRPNTGGEGKKFSPNREPAYALFDQGGKPRQVAEILEIKPSQSYIFFNEWRASSGGSTEPDPDDQK